MLTDFDWQADEETVVDDNRLALSETTARQRWSWGLFIMLLVLGPAVYGGLRWHTRQQTETIVKDILVSHNLVQMAVAGEDIEQLNLVLSGRELNWQEAQQRLLMTGDFANRPTFGLHALTASAQPTVTLSPDLQEAFVVYDQPYEQSEGNQVLLQQTAVYRQGSSGWLLSPPLEEFWRAIVITTTSYFTLTYPQRDEALALSLGRELDNFVVTFLCGNSTECFPPTLKLLLHFSPNPQSLAEIADSTSWLREDGSIILPTPTLVGLPIDEAGYQALYRGYATRILTAVFSRVSGYKCCQHGLMLSALLAKQASEFGLQPWPLTAAEYRQLLNVSFTSEDHEELLTLDLDTPERWLQALALVDFLIAETEMPTLRLGFELLRPGTLSLEISLPQLLREDDFINRWLAFIYQQAGYEQPASPVNLPPAIHAACSGAQGAVLVRYDVTTAVWSQIATAPHLGRKTQIWSLPHSEGYLAFQEIWSQFEIEARMTLHYEDVDYILMRIAEPMFRPVPHYLFAGQTDPTGRYLLLFDQGPSRYLLRYFLVDFMNCSQGLCPTVVLFGRPVWSPSGDHLLLAERPSPDDNADLETQLQRLTVMRGAGNGQSLIAVGRGYNPHWLDNDHYLYMRLNEAGMPEVIQASTADDLPQLWLEAADLLPDAPTSVRPSTLTISDIAIYSPQQAAILATAGAAGVTASYLFLWQPPEGPILVYQSNDPLTMSFAPNGLWLTATEPDGLVTLIQTTTKTQQQFHSPQVTPDWTADGQWLLTGRENYLLLMMPDADYQQMVFYNMPACHLISWAE
jgi:hypothetical protein